VFLKETIKMKTSFGGLKTGKKQRITNLYIWGNLPEKTKKLNF